MVIVRTWLIVCLALIWAPLAAHCQVKAISGLQLLECHSQNTSSETPDSNCCDTLCCACNSAQHHLPQRQIAICVILSAVVPTTLSELENSLVPDANPGILTDSPPEGLNTWQFSSRAALPVRAPSLAS